MKIHKDLLTHDGVAPAETGRVLDLGFNGDFDHKKHDWNMLFVQFPAKAGGSDMTLTAFSAQSGVANLATNANAIGSIIVPAETIQKGGVVGFNMPTGLKRYFTIAFTGTTLPDAVTAGVTDEVDTDLAFNWTNYKAATGTSEIRQKSENVGEVIDGTVHEKISS
jgi:hypothetical protein